MLLAALIFEDNLIEVLLSVILMFNVGAYSFLWYKVRNIEEKQENQRDEVERVKSAISKLKNRIFGYSEDSTSEGHILETEKRFDEITDSLDSISDKIQRMDEKRYEEHEVVRKRNEKIISMLDREEKLDISEDDFEVKS